MIMKRIPNEKVLSTLSYNDIAIRNPLQNQALNGLIIYISHLSYLNIAAVVEEIEPHICLNAMEK